MAEQNYQPQVRDTSNGANVHTYIPRADGSILIGGVVYIPQAGGATATVPVAVATLVATPVATHVTAPVPVAQPYVIPPGGPAVPAVTVPLTSASPQLPFFPYAIASYHPTPWYRYMPASAFLHLSFPPPLNPKDPKLKSVSSLNNQFSTLNLPIRLLSTTRPSPPNPFTTATQQCTSNNQPSTPSDSPPTRCKLLNWPLLRASRWTRVRR